MVECCPTVRVLGTRARLAARTGVSASAAEIGGGRGDSAVQAHLGYWLAAPRPGGRTPWSRTQMQPWAARVAPVPMAS